MIAKPLLKTAASFIAIAAFAACATSRAARASCSRRRPTAAEAQAYVDSAERDLAAMSERENRIAWLYNTYINYDTEWLQQRSDAEGTAARVRMASGAARFANIEMPAETRRKIDLLRLSLSLPAPQREGAAEELAAINTRLASRVFNRAHRLSGPPSHSRRSRDVDGYRAQSR